MRLVHAECNDGDAQDGLFKIVLPYSVDIWPAHVPKGALAREVVSTRAHQYLTEALVLEAHARMEYHDAHTMTFSLPSKISKFGSV